MKREKLDLTADDGYAALRGHVAERAGLARARHGPSIGIEQIEALLADTDVVRFPSRIMFAAEPLMPGEFGWARPRGERPSDGFDLILHPSFEGNAQAVPLLAAYHVVAINYLDVATREEAELFGATLFDMEIDDYYARICEFADSLSEMPAYDPTIAQRFEDAASGGSSGSPGGGSCGSGHGCGCSSGGA